MPAPVLDAPGRGSLLLLIPEWALVYASLALFALAVVGLFLMMRYATADAPEWALRDGDIETGRTVVDTQ